ncbi:MAG TPA: CDP-glycerol glycerophosphotransferase family protein [Ilumatobacteraceae bacterium]|nr:CDP-glycerol glycerophosphotransferase family protein [Ilumatobacteraceae bacterium]
MAETSADVPPRREPRSGIAELAVGRKGLVPRLSATLQRFVRERVGSFPVRLMIRLLQWPIRAVMRPVVSRLPRDPKLVAFGGFLDRFADNPAYLFLHMAESSSMRCVWISGSRATVARVRDAGYEAALRWSLRGILVGLRASWYVYAWYAADINRWFGDGATTLNLWHGVGIKPIGRGRASETGGGSLAYAAPEGSWTARAFADERRPPDWLLTTSPMITPVFAKSFGISTDRCIEFGYPRNDHLVEGRKPHPLLVDDGLYEALQRRRPVVGYFPTFRDGSASLPGGVPLINEMSDIVKAQGGTFVFKAHHLVLSLNAGSGATVDDDAESATVVLPKDADLNAYLGECDVLITDYSSVTSDYLFLRRPVILFVPDFDEYAEGRGFMFDPRKMMPGTITRTKAELYDVLKDVSRLTVSPNNEEILDAYWSPGARGGASERIAGFIEEQSAKGTRT